MPTLNVWSVFNRCRFLRGTDNRGNGMNHEETKAIRNLMKYGYLNEATLQEVEQRYIALCRLQATSAFKKDYNKSCTIYLNVRDYFIGLLKSELTAFNMQGIDKILLVIKSMNNPRTAIIRGQL